MLEMERDAVKRTKITRLLTSLNQEDLRNSQCLGGIDAAVIED